MWRSAFAEVHGWLIAKIRAHSKASQLMSTTIPTELEEHSYSSKEIPA